MILHGVKVRIAVNHVKRRCPGLAERARGIRLHAPMKYVGSGVPAFSIPAFAEPIRDAAQGKVVEEVKTSSSKWIKTKGPGYQRFHWQNGYGDFSIGESGVAALKKYIAQQKEHHRRKTFQAEFRAFLAKYCLEYDERYVWD